MALTRRVGAALAACTLTFLERRPIDVSLASRQHEAFEAALRELSVQVESLPPLDDLADSVFIEDTAIVLDELAIITRPGAASRRPEVVHTARALAPHRKLVFIEEPGTVEGGDVIHLGRRLLVGRSRRTNDAGIQQLHSIVTPLGYTLDVLAVNNALHLKSACTRIDDETVLANRNWIDITQLGVPRVLTVAADEPLAANVVPAGNCVIVSSAFPETCTMLERAGYRAHSLDVSELHKAEGGLTCLSLMF